MIKIKFILFFLLFSLSQTIFAQKGFNTKVSFCNNASSVEPVSTILYGEDEVYGSIDSVMPNQCVEKTISLPNLVEVRLFYGHEITPKFARLSNGTHLKINHKNYHQKNGKLIETTELIVY